MNKLYFCKMQALGNDFVLVNAIDQPIKLERSTIAKLADRRFGVGFDQLLVLGPSTRAELYCRIFNADGSEAEQCGNGLRCVARFMHEEKLILKPALTIETKAGLIPVEIKNYEQIRANLGVPEIKPEPVLLSLETAPVALTVLSLGNPHAIYRVPSIDETPVSVWGKKIQAHSVFPQGVNVGFMEVLDRKNIRLRSHERGVGDTGACGSNACAAVIAGVMQGWLDTQTEVHFASGSVRVEWAGDAQAVFLTGPAERVFTGALELGE